GLDSLQPPAVANPLLGQQEQLASAAVVQQAPADGRLAGPVLGVDAVGQADEGLSAPVAGRRRDERLHGAPSVVRRHGPTSVSAVAAAARLALRLRPRGPRGQPDRGRARPAPRRNPRRAKERGKGTAPEGAGGAAAPAGWPPAPTA